MDVAIIVISLPTLRPSFRHWSLESIVGNLRSALSLGSMGSGHKSSFTVARLGPRSEPETAITGLLQPDLDYRIRAALIRKAYGMGEVGGEKAPKRLPDLRMLKESQFLDMSEIFWENNFPVRQA